VTGPLGVADVTKRYGRVSALEGVDLTIRPGTLHGLLGPNGSGKTTLVNVLLGLTEPTGGDVSRPAVRYGCSFQTPTVYPDLTVAENFGVFARMHGRDENGSAQELRETLSLSAVEHRRVGALSEGWRKRLDLALAFHNDPGFAILDEPLDDLDGLTRRRFRRFLATYPDDDRSVLVATHNPAYFGDALDRLTILEDGRVVYDGDPPTDRSIRATYQAAIRD
jgi:ABC-2 type transport system ATP-binding protein